MEALLHLAPVFINCFPSLASGDIYFRMLAHNDVEIWSNVPVEVFPRSWSPKRKPPQLLFWSCRLFMKFSTTWTSLDFYTVFDSSFRRSFMMFITIYHELHLRCILMEWALGPSHPWRGSVRSIETCFWDWSLKKLLSRVHHAFSLGLES